MTTRENGEQRGVGGGKNADFAGVALARPYPETAPTLGERAKKIPTDEGWDFGYWWWDGTPHQTTIESTESKRCGLLLTRANRIEKPAGTPFGRGRSSRFFALIGARKGRSTASAFRGQFNSRFGNRTRVPQSLSAVRTKLHGHCRAVQACRVRPVRGNAA